MDPETEVDGFDETAFEDALYDVLSAADRRFVLRTIANERTPLSVDRLASELTAASLSVPVDDVTGEQRAEALAALVHVHLPKLQDTGLITWDEDAETVDRSLLVRQLSVSTPLSGGLFDAPDETPPTGHPGSV